MLIECVFSLEYLHIQISNYIYIVFTHECIINILFYSKNHIKNTGSFHKTFFDNIMVKKSTTDMQARIK